MTSPAHYVITGTNSQGDVETLDAVGEESVHEVAAFFLEKLQDGWSQVFVYRADIHKGADAPSLVEVTADIANHAFEIWLAQYGMEDDLPHWIDVQLERLTINAELEVRAFRRGERSLARAA